MAVQRHGDMSWGEIAAALSPDEGPPLTAATVGKPLQLPTEPPAVAPARAPPQFPCWPGGCAPHPDLDAYDPA